VPQLRQEGENSEQIQKVITQHMALSVSFDLGAEIPVSDIDRICEGIG